MSAPFLFMTDGWTQTPTSRYQDHVIAHVVDATALGYFIIEDALYVVLDIALIWTLYTSGEMALMPQRVVVSDLEVEDGVKAELVRDVERLHAGETETLERMQLLPAEFPVRDVKLYERGERRRLIIEGESESLCIESLPHEGSIRFIKGDYEEHLGA